MVSGPEIPFQMAHAREVVSRGWTHIERQVTATEIAVRDEPTHAFDLARALIESTCRTILTERQVSYNRDDDLPNLFRLIRRNLPFLPPESSHEATARQSLEQTLSGLQSAIQGICELRNQYGFSAHGHETAPPRMEKTQAILVAGAADVIIGFLYGVHIQANTTEITASPSLYELNQDFNNFIDESHEICAVLDVAFWPSEVLFQMEPETYRLRLAEFIAGAESPEEMDDDG